MKKFIYVFIFVIATLVGASAQKKFTYSYASANSQSETPVVTWIDFYNGYIKDSGMTQFNYSHTDSNGNFVYINDRGNTFTFSSDYSEAWHTQKFLLFNQMSQTTKHYKFIGKGSQPAIDMFNGNK